MSDREMGEVAAGTSSAVDRGDVEAAGSRDVAVGATKLPRRSPRSGLALATAAAGVTLLIATSGGGAALLVWWTVNFHPDDAQTWMVPVGLVLFGTPIVAWFSVFASHVAWQFEEARPVVGSDVAGNGTPPFSFAGAAADVAGGHTNVRHDG